MFGAGSTTGRTRPHGARDRALLLVGFVAALRRSELAALTVEALTDHPNGLVLTLPRAPGWHVAGRRR